jgi:hypothetical protein
MEKNKPTATIPEKRIEATLCQMVKKHQGTCEKFTSPSRRAVPDRMITLPGGHIFFVECKATGKRLTDLQSADYHRRTSIGCKVFVVSSYADIEEVETYIVNKLTNR